MKSSVGFSVAKKKTPYQKAKEAEEEKRRRAEEEAAKVYEEFVEAFEVEEKPKAPPPTARQVGSSDVSKPGGGSGPDAAGSKRVSGISDKPKPKAFDDDEEEEPVAVQAKKQEKDKPRKIDLMLEKLKQEQQEREQREEQRETMRKENGGRAGSFRAAPSFEELGMSGASSFDCGDPLTTNLYIGNMAPDVDEKILLKEFGRFGAIGSVKVMWPRDEEQRRKGRNVGFVAFMRREDAARAMETMDGVILHDFELRIGWGKAVHLPAMPIWAGPGAGAALADAASGFTVPGGGGGSGGAAVPPPLALGGGGGVAGGGGGGGGGAPALPWGGGGGGVRHDTSRNMHDGVGPDIEVPILQDVKQRFVIDSLAMYVLKDGCPFEQIIMEEMQGDPEYAFLFKLDSPEHIYYRWRLYSLAEGDTLRTWRIDPFVMVEGGQRWLAPSMTAMQIGAKAAMAAVAPELAAGQRTVGHERGLTEKERDKFEDMLRNLTVERADIRAAMIFALDCADAGAEVVETVADALSIPETPIPLKIARLFLVSDILHNSTAPVRNATRYRSRFEAVLPGVFESLQEAYRAVETRITQETLRRCVLRVLRCWRERYVFADDYLNGLQATFLQPATDPRTLAQGNPSLAEQLEALSPEDLEKRCRLNGLVSTGGKEQLLARLLALDAHLNPNTQNNNNNNNNSNATGDGVAATAGLVAAAVAGEAAPAPASTEAAAAEVAAKPAAPPVSRWTTIDEDEEKQAMPSVPISKWLAQEAAAERARQEEAMRVAAAAAAAAAAEAEANKIFSDVESSDEEPGAAEAVRQAVASTIGAAVVDEKRRQKLRQVELACAALEAELEDIGLSKQEVEQR